ncbi:MAG: HAD family hydrolase [Candidatus Goldbacteria bacterium]|nr:HAD family hydrolase [Candidatus Goldiibacteriota bacterium]
MKKNRAAFLDRDGVLIREVGYLQDLKRVNFYCGNIEALKLLKQKKFKLIVVSNQSGVARGYFTEDFVRKTHRLIQKKLKKYKIKIDAFYYCPHHIRDVKIKKYFRNCFCRKPKPGMVLKAKKRFNIDLKNSFMIGDKLTDIKLGKNTGMKTFLLLTGYGREQKKMIDKDTKPDYICKNLLSAAKIIIKGEKNEKK